MHASFCTTFRHLKVFPFVVALSLTCVLSAVLEAREIKVILHPQPSCPLNMPVNVSFGMPFPKDFIADVSKIRLKDALGEEIPAHVRVLVPWRNLDTGADLASVRSALVQLQMSFSSVSTPISITVETGRSREKTIGELSIRDNWVLVNSSTYPQEYGVYEPPVYAILPPEWMGDCGIKTFTVPYGTYSDFNWYDDALTNNDPAKNSGQNFFKSMINDEVNVSTTNQIHYLNAGEYEPWLYDRAMTLYTIYMRSGDVNVMKEAHRASYFYAKHIKDDGFFDVKADGNDLKYSYGECIFTDLMLTGDEGWKDKIEKVTLAADTFDPVYNPTKTHGLWSERHFAFSWLTYITAFEATGKSIYRDKAKHYMDVLLMHQSTVQYNVAYGSAPLDGALMHDFLQHEGFWNSLRPYWIYSPFMTVLVVDAMQKYYQHSEDSRVVGSVCAFGDAIIKCGCRMTPPIEYTDTYAPWYLTSSTQPVEVQNLGCVVSSYGDEYSDFCHSLDVSKILAYAYYLSGQTKYKNELEKLLVAAQKTHTYWIRPDAHAYEKSIYRLSPPRAGNWWFRTTSDLDALTHNRKPPVYTADADLVAISSISSGELRVLGSPSQRGTINPSNGDSAKIYFRGNSSGTYVCRIFDLNRQLVWQKTQENLSTGMFEWNAENASSGGYIVNVQGPGFNQTKKLAVLK